MDEEVVQNDVRGATFVKNSVMDAQIDLKVVMDLSIFKMVDGTFCNPFHRV